METGSKLRDNAMRRTFVIVDGAYVEMQKMLKFKTIVKLGKSM